MKIKHGNVKNSLVCKRSVPDDPFQPFMFFFLIVFVKSCSWQNVGGIISLFFPFYYIIYRL